MPDLTVACFKQTSQRASHPVSPIAIDIYCVWYLFTASWVCVSAMIGSKSHSIQSCTLTRTHTLSANLNIIAPTKPFSYRFPAQNQVNHRREFHLSSGGVVDPYLRTQMVKWQREYNRHKNKNSNLLFGFFSYLLPFFIVQNNNKIKFNLFLLLFFSVFSSICFRF